MSQQTQPQQKQPETLRRGLTSGTTNIIPRANIQTNAAMLNIERTPATEAQDFEFFETNYEVKKGEKG